jgi:hypothetical protein
MTQTWVMKKLLLVTRDQQPTSEGALPGVAARIKNLIFYSEN